MLSCYVHERAVKSPFLPGETLVAQPLQSGLGFFPSEVPEIIVFVNTSWHQFITWPKIVLGLLIT